jgi:hypothetical protein
MYKPALAFITALALGLCTAAANAQHANQRGGASSYAPGGNVGVQNPGRNSAPGQQMLDRRTATMAPGHSYNAPGQQKIRARTTRTTR